MDWLWIDAFLMLLESIAQSLRVTSSKPPASRDPCQAFLHNALYSTYLFPTTAMFLSLPNRSSASLHIDHPASQEETFVPAEL